EVSVAGIVGGCGVRAPNGATDEATKHSSRSPIRCGQLASCRVRQPSWFASPGACLAFRGRMGCEGEREHGVTPVSPARVGTLYARAEVDGRAEVPASARRPFLLGLSAGLPSPSLLTG